jgi:hypothetical protein
VSRRPKNDTNDMPTLVPAVVVPRADWSDWSAAREHERLQREANARAIAINRPVYPQELAERIAQDTARYARDWRIIRVSLGAEWGRLLRSQPELDATATRQREELWRALLAGVSAVLRPVVSDLRAYLEMMIAAHEAAAYHVGFEAGRLEAATRIDPRGRIRHQSAPEPRTVQSAHAFRLHIDAED